MLGNNRLEAQCIDGVKRLCHIRGKMRKKVWVNQGDIVLIGLREFQDGKGDVILKVSTEWRRRRSAVHERGGREGRDAVFSRARARDARRAAINRSIGGAERDSAQRALQPARFRTAKSSTH